jgi:hypothetical protein
LDGITFELVSPCFIEDDGSLPGVEIANLTSSEIKAIYDSIRSRSKIASENAVLWIESEQRDVPLDSVPNAAALVAEGIADSFHFCFTDLRIGTVELPMLGLFVFADFIELDYRMGPHWTLETIDGFFRLLLEIRSIAPGLIIRFPSVEAPPDSDRFLDVWREYERSAS